MSSVKRRLDLVAKFLSAKPPKQGPSEGERLRAEHLARVPSDLRAAVAVALADPDNELHEWVFGPFAPWATIPPEFEYPRELVVWFLTPPREWFLGHACGRCGLNVPLLMTWANDPDPPKGGLVVFPICPSCGGITSFRASFRADDPP